MRFLYIVMWDSAVTMGTAVQENQLLFQVLCNISCLWCKNLKTLNYEEDLYHLTQTDTATIVVNLNVLCAHNIEFLF